jgi:hypothetical protein
MASPPILTPSGTNGWNIQKWQRVIEDATYQKMKMIPVIDEGDRLYGQLNIRKKARVSATVLAQSAEGTSLTPSNIIGTPVTVTPAGNYVMVQWSENEDAQIDINIDSESRGDIESALAEASDQSVLANVATLTQTMSAASVDGPMFRQAYGRLMGNTNGMATPGDKPQVYGIFSHTQYPNLGTIPEFNNAEVRGGSETPYVSGIWMKGGGVMLLMTTVITNDANGWHNCLFLPSAFVISWNKHTTLKSQEFELTNKVIAYNNFGSAVKHDLRAIDMRTTASAL